MFHFDKPIIPCQKYVTPCAKSASKMNTVIRIKPKLSAKAVCLFSNPAVYIYQFDVIMLKKLKYFLR